jgi:hypothetical protein
VKFYKIAISDGYSPKLEEYTLTSNQLTKVKSLDIITTNEITLDEYNPKDFLTLMFSYGVFLDIEKSWREAINESYMIENNKPESAIIEPNGKVLYRYSFK